MRTLQQGMADGLHLGAQVFIWHGGQVIADWAMGLARAGAAMTTHSLTLWRSAGKPLTAVAIAQLVERGLLGFDDPVAHHIPGFAAEGKEAITVRHLLTHTAGLSGIVGGAQSWDERIERICQLKPQRDWTPGEQAGYDPYSGWYLLGEIVRRLDGRPIERYLREAIFEPAGMTGARLGIDTDAARALGHRLAHSHKRTDAGRLEPEGHLNDPDGLAEIDPGAKVRGPARDLGLFYLALLHGGIAPGGDRRLLGAEMVERLTDRHRVGMYDRTFGAVIDWGLGFMLNSRHHAGDHPYDFGPHASVEAFGHAGRQCCNAFADPLHHLVVAWTTNGHPGEPLHQQRNHALHAAVYEDLNLARRVA